MKNFKSFASYEDLEDFDDYEEELVEQISHPRKKHKKLRDENTKERSRKFNKHRIKSRKYEEDSEF